MFIIFSFISVYSFNRNTRLRYSSWWESDELINYSKYIIGSGRKQPPGVCDKAVLKNFAIFTGKYLCWSLFLIKNFKAILLKRDSNTGAFLWIFQNFSDHLFWKTSATGYCCKMLFRHDQSKVICLLHSLLF